MTTELYWMTLTVFMTALFWVPYVLDRPVMRGIRPWLLDTKPEGSGPHSVWAQRAIRAHANAVENLAVFATLVLAANALGITGGVIATAAVVYFWSRIVHAVAETGTRLAAP